MTAFIGNVFVRIGIERAHKIPKTQTFLIAP